MKMLRFVVGGLILLVILVLWWLFSSKSSTPPSQPTPAEKAVVTKPTEEREVPKAEAEQLAKMDENIRKNANVPIEFYGKAVDQYGEPVGGAQAKCILTVHRGWMKSDQEDHVVTTATDGTFTFTGLEGGHIGILLEKTGYEFHSFNTMFKYSDTDVKKRHKPDPASPVEFVMWKLKGPEPMIKNEVFYKIIPDDRIYTVDLVRGKKIESGSAEGDLKVQIQRPVPMEGGKKFDWSFAVEVIGGGVHAVSPTDPYANEAPETGYQPRFEGKITADSSEWRDPIQKTFYLKSRNGAVYGRMKIEIYANYQDHSIFSADYFINPSGSRNLEFDSSKRISPSRVAEVGLEKAIEEARGGKK